MVLKPPCGVLVILRQLLGRPVIRAQLLRFSSRKSGCRARAIDVGDGSGRACLCGMGYVASSAAAGAHPDCLSERSPVTIHNRAGHRKVPGPLSLSAPTKCRSIHLRFPHHPPHPSATAAFRPRIHPRPIRRQTPTRSPLTQPFDLVARSDSHRYDVLRGLNERHVQERRQPAARLDLGAGPVGVVRLGLLI